MNLDKIMAFHSKLVLKNWDNTERHHFKPPGGKRFKNLQKKILNPFALVLIVQQKKKIHFI